MTTPVMVPAPGVTDLDGNQVMMQVGGPIERDLLGPDLDALPTLAEQLDRLDVALLDGVEAYVDVWLEISDQNGGGASLFWEGSDSEEARPRIMTGVHCDEQMDRRRLRRDALHDHQENVAEFGDYLIAELIRLRRFSDNRRTSPPVLKAIVRGFLATGGRLLISPDAVTLRRGSPVEMAGGMNIKPGDSDQRCADVMAATMAMAKLMRRWRAAPLIERFVRTLGVETEHGWIVLRGRAK